MLRVCALSLLLMAANAIDSALLCQPTENAQLLPPRSRVRIVYHLDGDIWVTDPSEGKHEQIGRLQGVAPVWSPDGNSIAFAGLDLDAPALHIASRKGEVLKQLALPGRSLLAKEQGRGGFDAVQWSPTGRYVSALWEPEAWQWKRVIWDLQTGRYRTENAGEELDSPAWSPIRDEYVTYQQFRSKPPFQIVLHDADKRTSRILLSSRISITKVLWSPNGQHILYTLAEDSWTEDAVQIGDPKERGIWTIGVDAKARKRVYVPRQRERLDSPSWSPRGDEIAFLRGGRKVTSPGIAIQRIQVIRATDGKFLRWHELQPLTGWEVIRMRWWANDIFLLLLERTGPVVSDKPGSFALACFDVKRKSTVVLFDGLKNAFEFDVWPRQRD